MAVFHGIITRLVDGRVCAYVIAPDAYGVLRPSTVFDPVRNDEVLDHAVTPDLRRLVYTTPDAVVSVVDGAESWRSSFEPGTGHVFYNRPGCVLANGGRDVWLFRPDAMAGHGRPDHWLVLDAETGAVRASAELGTCGHGATQIVHPDGRVLMGVGEGQDGCLIFLGELKDDRLELVRYPWADRVLVAVTPDGTRFMTADHGRQDVAFHAYPGGEVLARLNAEDLGHDPETIFVECAGGFLAPDTAVAALSGEIEDDDTWFGYRLVSLPGGIPGPEFPTDAPAIEDLAPLGDGTWLTSDPSGHPVRWSAQPTASG